LAGSLILILFFGFFSKTKIDKLLDDLYFDSVGWGGDRQPEQVQNQNKYNQVDTADRTTRGGGEEVDNQNEYNQVDTADRTPRGGGR